MNRKIFLNIAVKDLDRSRAFFGRLGFTFNEQFSDHTAICMVISEEIQAMLLTHEKFRTFTPPGIDICDTSKSLEALICLTCESREEVDKLAESAIAAGAGCFEDPTDYGFMYSRSFIDLDGHGWNLVHMDMSALPAEPSQHITTVTA